MRQREKALKAGERKFFDIMRKCGDKQHTMELQRTQHDIVSFLLACSVNLWWHGCLMLSLTLKWLSPITSSSFSMCHNGWSRGMFPFVAVFSWEIPCFQSLVCVDILHLMFKCCHTTYNIQFKLSTPSEMCKLNILCCSPRISLKLKAASFNFSLLSFSRFPRSLQPHSHRDSSVFHTYYKHGGCGCLSRCFNYLILPPSPDQRNSNTFSPLSLIFLGAREKSILKNFFNIMKAEGIN